MLRIEGSLKMEYCKLGRTDISVSAVGAGTMLWLPNKKISKEDLYKTYQRCLDNGMDFFDTAEVYGNGISEKLLGEFKKRDGRKIKIATKFAPPSSMNPAAPKRKNVSKNNPAALLEALDGSLERLGVDCIDLYQVHTPPKNGRIEEYMDVMAQAVKAGKVRAVGVCNFSKAQIKEAWEALEKHGIPLATAMAGYNILRRYPESNGVFDACRELGITLIPYAPLAEGTLTGKYRSGEKKVPIQYTVTTYFGHLDLTKEHNDNVPFVKRLFSKPREADIKKMEPLMSVLDEIAKAHNKTIAQVALNWLLSADDIHILPIPGTKTMKQADDNAGIAGWRLSQEERTRINHVEEQIR